MENHMSIDPKGVVPGLPDKAVKEPEVVHMSCRRGTSACNSMTATVIVVAGQPQRRMYRCTKCNHTWGLNVGGAVNL